MRKRINIHDNFIQLITILSSTRFLISTILYLFYKLFNLSYSFLQSMTSKINYNLCIFYGKKTQTLRVSSTETLEYLLFDIAKELYRVNQTQLAWKKRSQFFSFYGKASKMTFKVLKRIPERFFIYRLVFHYLHVVIC